VPDVTADPRYLMVNPETKSELAIPMMHQGKVIGVLDLESPQLNYFTDDHVQTLFYPAANLAVSLENARLYEQLAKEEARLERAIFRRQRGFRARFCGLFRPKITDSIWPRGICPPAKSAAISMSFAVRPAAIGNRTGRP